MNEKNIKETIRETRKEFGAIKDALHILHRLASRLAQKTGKTGKEYDNFIHEIEG